MRCTVRGESAPLRPGKSGASRRPAGKRGAVGGDGGQRGLSHRHPALAVPLAAHLQDPPRRVEIADPEADELGEPDAGAVEHLEDRAVALGEARLLPAGPVEKSLQILLAQERRETLGETGPLEIGTEPARRPRRAP